jgi:hypothetical protein
MTSPFRPELIDELIKDNLFFWTTAAHLSKKNETLSFSFKPNSNSTAPKVF